MEKRSLLQEFVIPYSKSSYLLVALSRRLVPITVPALALAMLLPVLSLLVYGQNKGSTPEMAENKVAPLDEYEVVLEETTTVSDPESDTTDTKREIAAATNIDVRPKSTSTNQTSDKKKTSRPVPSKENKADNHKSNKTLLGYAGKKVDQVVGFVSIK